MPSTRSGRNVQTSPQSQISSQQHRNATTNTKRGNSSDAVRARTTSAGPSTARGKKTGSTGSVTRAKKESTTKEAPASGGGAAAETTGHKNWRAEDWNGDDVDDKSATTGPQHAPSAPFLTAKPILISNASGRPRRQAGLEGAARLSRAYKEYLNDKESEESDLAPSAENEPEGTIVCRNEPEGGIGDGTKAGEQETPAAAVATRIHAPVVSAEVEDHAFMDMDIDDDDDNDEDFHVDDDDMDDDDDDDFEEDDLS